MRLSPKNKIQASFALAVATLLFFGCAAWWSAYRTFKIFNELERSTRIEDNLEAILVEVLNIETGIRGFVITGDEKFLEPYAQGLATIHRDVEAAEKLSGTDPHRNAQLAELRRWIDLKLVWSAEIVELQRSGDAEGARRRLATGRGRELMDEVRKLIGELDAEETARVQHRINASDAQARHTIVIVLVSGGLALSLIILAGMIVRRDFLLRTEAEHALRLASERLSLAARAANVGIWDWDIQRNVIFWDDAMYALYGLQKGQFSPSFDAFIERVHPEDRQKVKNGVEKSLRGEKEYMSEFRVVLPDQSIHYLEVNSVVLKNDAGEPIRMLGTNWDVTARKLAEKKFRDLLEAAPDGMVITNEKGEITLLNEKAEELFGFTRAELMGKPVEVLIPERHRATHPQKRQAFIAAPETRAMGAGLNLRALRKDGTEFPVEICLSPLQTESGILVIAAVRDVTDRTRIQEALQQSVEQQRQLAERLAVERTRLAEAQAIAKVGSWELDLRTNAVTWSEENHRIFGIEPGKSRISYETFLQRIPPEERDFVNRIYTDSVATHQPYAIDHRLQMDNGSIKFVHERGQTFYDEQGHPIRSVGTTQDVTERKLAEQAVRESEETLRMLTESMPQMSWMCRPDGWNIYFNQRWVEYTGLSLEESAGHGWNKPFHPNDKLRAWAAWKEATETAGKYELECQLRRADGIYRWFLIRGVPVRDSAGAIIKWIGTCTDIEDFKKTEEKIREFNRKLEQHSATLEKEVAKRTAELRDSVKSLQTLTYTIAHDLRTPLRGMVAYTDALLEDVPLDQTGRSYVQEIHQSADRMNALLTDLLTYSQLSHLDFPRYPIDLKRQIKTLLLGLKNEIRTAGAEIHVEDPIPNVAGNEALLEQILRNLISNALKFVRPGVTPKIVLWAEKRGRMIRIWVEDNGIGIAPEHKDKIFGVFHRLHTTEEYPGTGVGLAIASRAVDLMCGQIGVESEIGQGSKFWIELPQPDGSKS
jgi:PAS domain S-box-containing protein